jgi:hypothetical protein
MFAKTLLAATALALLAACSSGSSGAAAPAAGKADGGTVSAQELANKTLCNGFVADPAAQRELFVADSGTCTYGDAHLTVYRFSSNASRDSWIKAAAGFGLGRFVVVDRGVVVSDDQASADAVQAEIGGEIRTA